MTFFLGFIIGASLGLLVACIFLSSEPDAPARPPKKVSPEMAAAARADIDRLIRAQARAEAMVDRPPFSTGGDPHR